MTKRHAVKEEPGIDVKLLQSFLAGVDEGVTEDIFRAFFGPTRTAEFLAQGWLTCTVNRNLSGVEDIQYDWGPRAEATVEKKVSQNNKLRINPTDSVSIAEDIEVLL